MTFRQGLLASALLAAFIAPAQATTVALAADGQWQTFDVSDIESKSFGVEWIDAANTLSPGYGTPLNFTFTIASGAVGTLTVVDAVFNGDRFDVTNFGAALGSTSAVPLQAYASATNVGVDYDAAIANPSFSRGVFTLGAGSYSVSGVLTQSVFDDLGPLNSTGGALKLAVTSAVPEPATLAAMVAVLAVVAGITRRRKA